MTRTLLCSALILGALAAPAMAQNVASPGFANDVTPPGTTAVGNTAQAAPTPNQTGINAEASAATPSPLGGDNGQAQTGSSQPDQMTMNGSAGSQMSADSSTGNISAVSDNQHKYSPAHRAADNRSEAETTRQLNLAQASSAQATSQMQ